jgi:hypothetical protein
MRFPALVLLLCAFVAPPAVAVPAKPAARAPASKAAKPAPAAFDARDPASLIALLETMGAKAEVGEKSDGDVKLKVVTPSFSFGAQFVDCSKSGVACQGLAFSTSSEKQHANLAQLNAFNQTSLTCRVFQDQAAKPHVVYSTILTAQDTREEMRTHLGVWQGCMATFGAFLSDPNGYLAAAP